VARFRDWLDLGKSTFRSLTTNDVASLYALEWPETKKILIADHRAAIDGERKAFRRWIRTSSAAMYGLAKRLAPHRRILFLIAQIWFFICVVALFSQMNNPPFWTFVEIVATFLLMTALLAMELIDKIKFRDELALARELQSSLIPKNPPQSDSYEVAAFNHIANTVGGDIYDFVPLADGRLAVLFGDASGHGMAAGLVMAVAHASFRTQLDIDPSPCAIFASLNRILCRTGGPRSFFSCCYVLLSPNGEFEATIAGHPQILKVASDGKTVERLGRGAYPLGIKSALGWEVISGTLARTERLVLHSDGLTEARNAQDREFGDELVESIVGWHPESTSSLVVDAIVGEWRLFTQNGVSDDDVSIAVITRIR
jgi:phosphoserine phosphatase RsbU/P